MDTKMTELLKNQKKKKNAALYTDQSYKKQMHDL
jgi:hypothetical protein